jgi:hypothetical protein
LDWSYRLVALNFAAICAALKTPAPTLRVITDFRKRQRGLPRTTTSMQEPGSILPNTMRMVLQPNDKICHTTSSWIERLNSSALSESSILTGSRQRGKSNTWSRHRLLRHPTAGVLRNDYSPHGFPKPLNPINCISGCSDYIG